MSDRSKIEWTDASWNPVRAFRRGHRIGWHCEHVSEGCRHCYAETINRRLGTGLDYKPGHRAELEFVLSKRMEPLHWRRPRRIFVGSMTDIFADFVPDEMLDRIFAMMALCPQHTFQLLTKRPARMRAYMDAYQAAHEGARITEAVNAVLALSGRTWGRCGSTSTAITTHSRGTGARDGGGGCARHDFGWALKEWPFFNVWLGVSAEDQATADERVPLLLDTPAAVRFVSYEPALGPIDFNRWLKIDWQCSACRHYFSGRHHPTCPVCGQLGGWTGSHPFNGRHMPVDRTFPRQRGSGLDLIICGGESGPDARPMHPTWARTVRDQCAAAGVAFFFKQWGNWSPIGPLYGDNDEYEEAGPNPDRDVPVAPTGSIWDDGAQPPPGTWMMRRSRDKSARVLDNRTHDEFPETGAAAPIGSSR